MVLLELEEFTRLFFETQRLHAAAAGGDDDVSAAAAHAAAAAARGEEGHPDFSLLSYAAAAPLPLPQPPMSFLVFATAEVDALCCCHLLSSFIDARSLFLSDQCDHPNISLEIEIVNGVSDILAWIDKQLAPLQQGRRQAAAGSRGAAAFLQEEEQQQKQQQQEIGGEYVLPFYDRILFFGCGALDDEEAVSFSSPSSSAAAAAKWREKRERRRQQQQQEEDEEEEDSSSFSRRSSSSTGGGEAATAAGGGDTATMLAAATDFFLHKTVRQRAVWLLQQQQQRRPPRPLPPRSRRHHNNRRSRSKRPRDSSSFGDRDMEEVAAGERGLGEGTAAEAAADIFSDNNSEDDFSLCGGRDEDEEEREFSSIAAAENENKLWEEEELQKLERRLRSSIRLAVLDARRPVHASLIEDSRWWMPMEAAELAAVEQQHRKKCAASAAAAAAGEDSSSIRGSGVYWSTPCACLLARLLQPQYDIDSSTFAYGGAVAAASFLLEGYAAEEEYNTWLLSIKDINVSRFPYVEEDDNGGLLPLLRIGSLQDSLGLSVLLLFRSLTGEEAAAPGGAAARSWHLQQQSNELRVYCGLQAKDMLNPFIGLAASQQQRVYDYLRQTLQLRDRLCLNWIRHVSQAKERGTFPSIPNLDAALFLHAVLAQRPPPSQDPPEMLPYKRNAIQALQLLRGITTQFPQEKRRALQQLQHAHALVSQHLLQLFRHLDFCRSWAARRGVLLITLRHPASFLLDAHYLRSFALLCSLKHANGRESKRLPTVLHVYVEGTSAAATSRSLIYACTPNASAEKPDIFPAVLRRLVLGRSPQLNSIHADGEGRRNPRSREREKRRQERRRGRNGGSSSEERGSEEQANSSSSEEETDPSSRRSRGVREPHRKGGRRAGRRVNAGRGDEEEWNRRRGDVAKETLSKVVALDSGCVNLLHVTVQRLAADVQKQVAALYLLELRRIRRREEDGEEGREVDEEVEEEGDDDEEEQEEEESKEEAEDDEEAEVNEDHEDDVGTEDGMAGKEGNSQQEEESRDSRRRPSEAAAADRRKDSWEHDSEGSIREAV